MQTEQEQNLKELIKSFYVVNDDYLIEYYDGYLIYFFDHDNITWLSYIIDRHSYLLLPIKKGCECEISDILSSEKSDEFSYETFFDETLKSERFLDNCYVLNTHNNNLREVTKSEITAIMNED